MYNALDKEVYRITYAYGGQLVECDSEAALIQYCAKQAAIGRSITSVSRIYADRKETPRMKVMSTKEYKDAADAEKNRIASGILEAGDTVRTPRFMTVTLKEVFDSVTAMEEAGYTEPTHLINEMYAVKGKSIGENRMVFAAGKKN